MKGKEKVNFDYPQRRYGFGNEPSPSKSINYRSKTRLFSKLQIFLGPDLWKAIKESPLGVVIKLHELNFIWCSRIVHHIVSRQLVTRKKYELWFLIDDTPVRFTLREFGQITGLNCGAFVEEEQTVVDEWEFLSKLDMSGNRVSPTLEDLCAAFASGKIKSEDDKLRVAYLVIVASVILGLDRRSPIPKKITRLAIDLERFVAYPWGRVGLEELVMEVKKTDLDRHSYVMGGFLQVFQVWAYMVIPSLGKAVGGKITDDGPPLLQYKGSKARMISLEDVGFVDNSAIGVDSPDWDDEIEDAKVDNIVAYYKGKKKFSRAMWVVDPGMETRTPPKEKKRKEIDEEAEGSRRVKRRSVTPIEEGWADALEKLKTFFVEKLQELFDDVQALTGRVGKMEADLTKISRAMQAKSPTKARIPPKKAPIKRKPATEKKKPIKPETKKTPVEEEHVGDKVNRRVTRSSQVLLLTNFPHS